MGRAKRDTEGNNDMKGFYIDTSSNGKYMIYFNAYDDIITDDFYYTSSYIVLQARLLGLSYPDYLLFCQSKGAKLKGRTGYINVLWEDKNQCQEICNMLEKEWQTLLKKIKFK